MAQHNAIEKAAEAAAAPAKKATRKDRIG